ncbi:penicillin-binding protein 1C [Hymenobacter wooponensis]|uniref:peptidoglycan glycosyltransferase n=1 Tax=Hymenobacter wooponensis TaxID=1525360 RepID=A0A4Z0MUI0_9BACT|nr:penicillin-binding protein 1C [Hymenobacter wooponensis]TGD83129.1 penicillin-binding protein 1C [Hymenobacter wooponensis]
MNRRTISRVLAAVGLVLLLLLGLNLAFPLPPAPHYSPIVLAADGTVLHAYLNPTQKWRMKTELREITPVLRKAILEKEDRWFRWHLGVNPVALVHAAGRNLFGTGRTTGASTITMQVARLLEPKERTFGNKLLEMLRATQLELHYSKEEILQLYLNLVPYGGNVEGVKSAALLYFQQTPDYLSLAQTVTLAIIPNRPRGLVLGKNNAAVLHERNRWLRRFGAAGLFPPQDVEYALLEPLDVQRHAAPALAPHLSRRLVRQFPRQAIIRSGLERNKQSKAEELTRNYVRRLQELGITQAAVLVVNNRTRQVEAYVGSADFRDFASRGQNDGVLAVRSPGSTLKPFLYALAMDRGLVTPKQMLPDVPTNFQGYRPENFDKHCNGEVTLERALAYSLNIPAVRVLNQLGVPAFTDKLRQAGFENVTRNRTRLGLSSILGGCGASLEELTSLYVTLANGGQYAQLQYRLPSLLPASAQGKEGPDNSSKNSTPLAVGREPTNMVPLISEASAFLITDILAQLTRPDLPINAASSMRLPKIAWKTGTSYGRRDAWSIGYNKQYTIGVWVGNFSGQGSPALSGAEVATPLLFDLFNAVAYNSPNNWFVPPATLDFRLVCAESGLVPGENCPNQVIDYFLPNISHGQRCQHQREVLVSADGSFTYCRACAPAAGYRRELYPNLLPEVSAYKEAQGIPYRRLPPHNPQCQLVRGGQERAPSITSPTANTEYVLNRHEKQQLLLTCTTDNEVRQVFWYVNDKFLRAATATERVFIQPPPGPLKISCADDHGRNTDVLVTVTELD